MELGWIDFSKNERDDILNTLDSLSEKGTLDELGIAPIRDGFSDLFFPGTSTLQTRAKYFFLIPYACMRLANSDGLTPKNAYERLYSFEKKTAELLQLHAADEKGIIGGAFVGRKEWIKRPPSTLYWAGLRRYGIFNSDCSLTEYLKILCETKRNKEILKLTENGCDGDDCDDKDAGATRTLRFFNVPIVDETYEEALSIRLTETEAEFLRERICFSAPDSLLTYLLKNRTYALECDNFEQLTETITDEKLKRDMATAVRFSDFTYVLRVVYNLVVSQDKNERAVDEMKRLSQNLRAIADIDVDAIFLRLGLNNDRLKKFLRDAKVAMFEENVDELRKVVTAREKSIKGAARAKTLNTSEAYADKWLCGGKLEYRFSNAMNILRDIFEAEVENV